MRRIGITIFLGVVPVIASAQRLPAPKVEWNRDFSAGLMVAHTQTSDGGYLFAGLCNFGTNYGGDDIWLRRLNARGDLVWERILGGDRDDSVSHVGESSNGDFVLVGSSNSGPGGTKTSANYGEYDAWIIRINSAGDQLWDVTVGTEKYDFPSAWQLTPDGLILGMTPFSVSTPNEPSGNKSCPQYGFGDYWVTKISTNGSILWQARFGGSNHDSLNAVRSMAGGGFLLVGTSESFPSGNKTSPRYGFRNLWCVRIDANGNKIWDESYGGGGESLASVIVLEDGTFVLVGTSSSGIGGTKTSPGYGSDDFWIMKVDGASQQLWDFSFGGSSADTATTAERLADGGYLIAGRSASPPSGNKTAPFFGWTDYWVVRLNSAGDVLWDRSFGGPGHEVLNSAQQTRDGAFILCGASASGPSGNRQSPLLAWYDAWVVRLSATGEKLWDRSYDLPTNYPPYYASQGHLNQTADGGFMLFGDTNNDTDYYESWSIKLALEQPVLSMPAQTPGAGYRFILTGTSNRYLAEYSTNLQEWVPFSTDVVPSTGDQIEVLDTGANFGTARYYRARLQP